MFVFARMSLGTPIARSDARVPCSQGQAALFGKGPQEISPALWAEAARSVRGRFVVEGTGKAEPRSSRRAQAKHRAGDREKAGKNWRDGSTQNLLRERDGIEDALRKQRSRQRSLTAPSDETFKGYAPFSHRTVSFGSPPSQRSKDRKDCFRVSDGALGRKCRLPRAQIGWLACSINAAEFN